MCVCVFVIAFSGRVFLLNTGSVPTKINGRATLLHLCWLCRDVALPPRLADGPRAGGGAGGPARPADAFRYRRWHVRLQHVTWFES